MAKCILMSIKPKYVSMILNKTKTIEVRKRFPSDYVGWVYIYCTKARHYTDLLINNVSQKRIFLNTMKAFWLDDFSRFEHLKMLNGKVVARFWCDNVEEFGSKYAYAHKDNHFYDILKCACLTPRELTEYAHFTYEEHIKGKSKLYAIHITKLEIFDKPKELNEFYGYTDKKVEWYTGLPKVRVLTSLSRAPQSQQYIEVEE